jgi:hypothetical protein
MAHPLVIEEESGTCRGKVHPHNGYYAGDFSTIDSIDFRRRAAAPRHLRVVAASQVEFRTTDAGPVSWGDAA